MALRFKLDENLPRDAEQLLAAEGHDAQATIAEGLGGRDDSSVLDACRREQRILVTFDLDFGDIRLYPPETHHGVWVLRPASQSIEATLTLLRRALGLLESERTGQRLWILEQGRVRIRE